MTTELLDGLIAELDEPRRTMATWVRRCILREFGLRSQARADLLFGLTILVRRELDHPGEALRTRKAALEQAMKPILSNYPK